MKLQMSIKDFADRFGVTPGTIRKWELRAKYNHIAQQAGIAGFQSVMLRL